MNETPISIFENVPVMALADLAARMKRTPEAVTAIVITLAEQLKDTADRYFIQGPDGWLVTRDGASLIASELRGVRASAALAKILAEFDACQAPAKAAPAKKDIDELVNGLAWRAKSLAVDQCERIRCELGTICKRENITPEDMSEIAASYARFPLNGKNNTAPESVVNYHYKALLTRVLDREASALCSSEQKEGHK